MPPSRWTSTTPDVPHITSLRGVGPTWSARLARVGIRDCEDLIRATLNDRALFAAATGIARQRLDRWCDVALLLRIPNLEPVHADLLVNVGIRSIDALAASNPPALWLRMRNRCARKRQLQLTPSLVDVRSWVNATRFAFGRHL